MNTSRGKITQEDAEPTAGEAKLAIGAAIWIGLIIGFLFYGAVFLFGWVIYRWVS